MADLQPPELAELVDFPERPRTENWSLRAALTRYAQPQPMRVSRLLDVVRRIEAAFAADLAVLRSDGPGLWAALGSHTDLEGRSQLLGVLAAAQQIDRLADDLAAWAVRRDTVRPDDAVDATIADVTAQLDALGVAEPVDTRPPPSRRRG